MIRSPHVRMDRCGREKPYIRFRNDENQSSYAIARINRWVQRYEMNSAPDDIQHWIIISFVSNSHNDMMIYTRFFMLVDVVCSFDVQHRAGKDIRTTYIYPTSWLLFISLCAAGKSTYKSLSPFWCFEIITNLLLYYIQHHPILFKWSVQSRWRHFEFNAKGKFCSDENEYDSQLTPTWTANHFFNICLKNVNNLHQKNPFDLVLRRISKKAQFYLSWNEMSSSIRLFFWVFVFAWLL